MEILSWITNILAIIGWIVNIRYRKYAMLIFTVGTLLSIIYFWNTDQLPFLYRFIIYFVIDIVTIWHILFRENKK